MSKKKASKSTLTIILGTIFFILGLSGMGICLAFYFNEHLKLNQSLLGFGVLACMAIAYFSMRQIIIANGSWKVAVKESILSGEEPIRVHWKYERAEWLAFAKQEVARKRKNARWVFLVVASCVLIGGGIYVLNTEEFIPEVFWSLLGLVALIFGLIWWSVSNFLIRQSDGYLEANDPQVHIAKTAIVINKELVLPLSTVGVSLHKLEEATKFGIPCLLFTVRVSGGEHDSYQTHYIPIPNQHLENINYIIAQISE